MYACVGSGGRDMYRKLDLKNFFSLILNHRSLVYAQEPYFGNGMVLTIS